ncbi:MAG: ATPase, T2SS/T4P/T4SS family [Patescibacteria group bacterium]|nr:ATPase, T2SS/T4P/T4SS family [Patescibacteria group bacterium]
MVISNERLKTIIEQLGIIAPERLEGAMVFAQKNKTPLAEVLVDSDLISDDHLGEIIAAELKYEFIDLEKIVIDEAVLKIIPKVMAKAQKIIAFGRAENVLKLAMVNPGNLRLVKLIEKKTGEQAKVYYTTAQNIESALTKYQQSIVKEFAKIIQENISEAKSSKDKNDLPIIKIVDTVIEYAYDNKASDIHIEPLEEKTLVRFRIDGILHDIIDLPKAVHELIVMRIKIMSKLRTDEHLSAQDGKIRSKINENNLDIRVSIIPVVDGEKIVLRLLSEKNRQFGLEDLGMSAADLFKVKKEYSKPYGMVLATGPTGSGKTTSLYAILKILNRREVNISTIEDPVEYDIEGVNQIQVNPKTNLTFAAGLRSILRQDPDIIMVGEIRDQDTAEIAINSAMTGHLVLSTLHTNDAATALPRFLEMNIEPFLIASTVNIIVAQRLIRKNCTECIVSEEKTLEELKTKFSATLIEKLFGFDNKSIRLYRSKGCPVCGNTGYAGRIGIYEVLDVTESIRDLIMKRADADQIKKMAVSEGMTTMIEDGVRKALAGITTIEEVLRATRE